MGPSLRWDDETAHYDNAAVYLPVRPDLCIIASCPGSITGNSSSMVAVAQLVESRIVIPVVVGSSPISHPTGYKHLAQLFGPGLFVFHHQ